MMYTFSKTKQISQRFKNIILAVLFALTQLVTPLTFSGIAGATPPGNNGTVKVDGTDIDQLHDEDSHLGCTFNINWFGYDKANGIDATVNFALQAPTHGTGYSLNVAGDTTPTFNSPGGAVLDHSEQYTLSFTGTPQSQGYHVKLTVNTPHSKGSDEKHKVFWVEGCGQPPVVKPCTVYTQAGEVRPSNLLGFDFSQTRSTGHYNFVADGLHIWTEGTASTDKVAAYKSVDVPLGDVGTPSLNYDNNFGINPGYQLVMDFNHDGTPDGILVGETVYGNNWWLANGSSAAQSGAPHTGGATVVSGTVRSMSGSQHSLTLTFRPLASR